MTTKDVIEAFLSGKPAGNGNLFTLDGKLVSYQLPIAKHGKTGVKILAKTHCVKPDGCVSRTTSKHRSALLAACARRGISVDETETL